jgi:putative FmdB family regulatory protein
MTKGEDMPIYDFRCQDCGKVSEVLVRSAGDRAVQCEACGSGNVEKLISASYIMKTEVSTPGATCCGSAERCDSPPCSTGETCHRA